MSNAFLYRMPAGIPGDVTRREAARIEQAIFDANYPVTEYGLPVKKVSGKIRPMAEHDTDQPYGFLVRPFPTQSGDAANAPLTTAAVPPTSGIGDVLVAGYMTVKVLDGTPAAGGSVYYRSEQESPEVTIGRLEVAAGSPVANIAITNCIFMGAFDSDGNGEIRFNV